MNLFACFFDTDTVKIQKQIINLSSENSLVRNNAIKALYQLSIKNPANPIIIRADGGIHLIAQIWNTDSDDATREMAQKTLSACAITLSGHEAPVIALAALSNNLLASGSGDASIKIWNLDSKNCRATLTEHTGKVRALEALPHDRFASGSDDCSIKIWDVASGQCLTTLAGHDAPVTALAALPNDFLATAARDGSIKIWNMVSWKCEATLLGNLGSIFALAALPGNRLAAAGIDGYSVQIWDVGSKTCVSTLEDDPTVLVALADGRLALAGTGATCSFGGAIRVWNVATSECEARLEEHTSSVTALARLSDKCLVSASRDQSIRIWNGASGECKATLIGHSTAVCSLTVLPNEDSVSRLVSGAEDGTIRVWDICLNPELLPSNNVSAEEDNRSGFEKHGTRSFSNA